MCEVNVFLKQSFNFLWQKLIETSKAFLIDAITVKLSLGSNFSKLTHYLPSTVLFLLSTYLKR